MRLACPDNQMVCQWLSFRLHQPSHASRQSQLHGLWNNSIGTTIWTSTSTIMYKASLIRSSQFSLTALALLTSRADSSFKIKTGTRVLIEILMIFNSNLLMLRETMVLLIFCKRVHMIIQTLKKRVLRILLNCSSGLLHPYTVKKISRTRKLPRTFFWNLTE